MRFTWRSHFAVTALAGLLLLPFAGCSSQQQQASDQVEASDQQGSSEGEEENADAQSQGEEGNGEETANATEQNADANEENVNNSENSGENIVAENSQNAPANGDLQEIINEMGANGTESAPVAVNDGAVPSNEGLTEVPVNDGSTGAEAPLNAATNVAPSDGAPAAAPVSSVAGLPEMGSKMAYVVEAGDTLGKIATKVYGDQKRWKDISDLTGLSNPNNIYPGDVVFYTLEDSSSQFAASYEGMSRGKETVQQGDTLASIAKRVYGSSRSWRHIWRQNDNIDNPDKLTAGMTVFYVVKESINTSLNDAVETAKSIKLTFKAPVKAKALKQVKPSTVPEIAFI